jgi:hypothetical protein
VYGNMYCLLTIKQIGACIYFPKAALTAFLCNGEKAHFLRDSNLILNMT